MAARRASSPCRGIKREEPAQALRTSLELLGVEVGRLGGASGSDDRTESLKNQDDDACYPYTKRQIGHELSHYGGLALALEGLRFRRKSASVAIELRVHTARPAQDHSIGHQIRASAYRLERGRQRYWLCLLRDGM